MALLTRVRLRASQPLAAVLALALSVSVLSGLAVPASAGADYQQPKVGACHKLTYKQLLSPSAPNKSVRCGTRGVKSVTAKVGQLPAGVTWADPDAAWVVAGSACVKAVSARLGRTAQKRAMSAFGVGVWMPNAAQRANGANWFRCDAYVERAEALTPIKRSTRPMLAAKIPDNQRLCLTRGQYHTSCDAAHMWRIVAAVKLAGTTYPTDIATAAHAACAGKITTQRGYLVWPSEEQWTSGFRFARCFNKQKKGTGGLAKVAGRADSDLVGARVVGRIAG